MAPYNPQSAEAEDSKLEDKQRRKDINTHICAFHALAILLTHGQGRYRNMGKKRSEEYDYREINATTEQRALQTETE